MTDGMPGMWETSVTVRDSRDGENRPHRVVVDQCLVARWAPRRPVPGQVESPQWPIRTGAAGILKDTGGPKLNLVATLSAVSALSGRPDEVSRNKQADRWASGCSGAVERGEVVSHKTWQVEVDWWPLLLVLVLVLVLVDQG